MGFVELKKFVAGRGRRSIKVAHLFDVDWYRSQLSDELLQPGHEYNHFAREGWAKGYQPHPLFDVDWYLKQCPSVEAEGENPLYHYITEGWKAGFDPHPMFNVRWYLENHRDVDESGLEPLGHYVNFGAQEGRQPHPMLDVPWYLGKLGAQNGVDLNPLVHFVTVGWKGGLNPNPNTDLNRYLKQFPDVREQGFAKLMGVMGENVSLQLKRYERRELHAPLPGTVAHLDSAKVSHIGRPFHQLAVSAASRVKRGRVSDEYELIRDYFDVSFYIMRYADMARAKSVDVIDHYIKHGAKEGRNPTQYFSTKAYVDRYADVRASGVNPFFHWLAIGRSEGRIAQPFSKFDEMSKLIGQPPRDVQEALIERQTDLRQRLEYGVLGEMVAKASEIEPLIAHSWKEAFSIKTPPFHSDPVVSQTVAIEAMQSEVGFKRAKAVVVIPHCRLSGATRIAGYLASALANRHGPEEVVVVSTDMDEMQFPGWFPEGCRHVSQARYGEGIPDGLQDKLLVEFVRSLKPECVFNINSRIFWDAIKSFGKALANSCNVYCYFFCNDKNLHGNWDGYPLRKLYRHFDVLAGVITDSHYLAEDLKTRYMIPPDQAKKIVTLETPVDGSPGLAPQPDFSAERKKTVFWAGRFDRQKRVDLVYHIARTMPSVEFRLWGEAVIKDARIDSSPPPNVRLMGLYGSLDELAFDECDAWLYTAEWDGVPNMLIEIAALGVPIVGSIAGGTGEILHSDKSWPVDDIEDVNRYVAALRTILEFPEEARQRALRLREFVLHRRTMDRYEQTLSEFLLATDTLG